MDYNFTFFCWSFKSFSSRTKINMRENNIVSIVQRYSIPISNSKCRHHIIILTSDNTNYIFGVVEKYTNTYP